MQCLFTVEPFSVDFKTNLDGIMHTNENFVAKKISFDQQSTNEQTIEK